MDEAVGEMSLLLLFDEATPGDRLPSLSLIYFKYI